MSGSVSRTSAPILPGTVKRYRNYIMLLAALFFCVVFIETMAPRRIDWTPSFARQDKIPYGSYVLYDILPELFPGDTIVTADLPAYNVLDAEGEDDRRTYLVINQTFAPDELDTRALLAFVDQGNAAFIAASNISGSFADTLGLNIGYAILSSAADSIGINFTNPALRAGGEYRVRRASADYYLENFDSLGATVLGVNDAGLPNFIRLDHGQGTIYLSTVPFLFTNYHLLRSPEGEYAARALSYIPDGPIIWDDYYKEGRVLVESPLRFIWSRESLSWALYTGLVGVVLFIIFMGKRRQRIIPEIRPLPNTTLEFAETVGRLYYQHGDHNNLVEKKIAYFFDHIRTVCGVATNQRDDAFLRTVAARSGVDLESVRTVFGYIDRLRASGTVGEEQLVALNASIEKFYADSKRAPGRTAGE